MALKLRPYQTEAIDAFLAYVGKGDKSRGIVVFPTGCGKTIFGLALAEAVGGRTLWIAHREELISQPIKALRAMRPDIRPGVIKAERNEWARDFVFASVQTAWREDRRSKLKGFDLVIVDECHHAAAESYKLVLEAAGVFDQGGPPLLGLTATPERRDNVKLDGVFQDIVYQFQLRTAVERGYLADVEMVQRPIRVDLDKVKTKGGDFSEGSLDMALLEANIVGEVCSAVDEFARDRKTIIFTVSVKQAEMISERLQSQGLRATHVSGETPRDVRNKRIKGLASGEFTHVVNCMLLLEGFDEPTVDCIVMARPTTSKSLYIQAAGRGLRISPGKTNCLIIDMVGLSRRHTLIQAPVIFGKEEKKGGEGVHDDDQEVADAPMVASNPLLVTQLKGVASVSRSKLQWVRAKNGVYALNCGEGGNVLMRNVGKDEWMVEVMGRRDTREREVLTMDPVGLELAQGIAEDYVRRAKNVYLTSKSARWRDAPASDKQIEALRKWKMETKEGLTKGEASDMMTAATASNWRNDLATAKQMSALRRHGKSFDEKSLTKGEAGRMLSQLRA